MINIILKFIFNQISIIKYEFENKKEKNNEYITIKKKRKKRHLNLKCQPYIEFY